jgi:4-diphosphocytidyl-2-C-methyl-D-erythritol kinase
LKVLSPAKINLFLQVAGKRGDGYHELVTLMCCISLYDVIRMDCNTAKISVQCDTIEVPKGETNLAYQAAGLFYGTMKQDSAGRKKVAGAEGVSIFIEKNIPVAAGLGGGSSNAASVLKGLNAHYGHPFTLSQLSAMGLRIGADVPYLLYRKPAIARGIGEKLTPYKGLSSMPVLVICPDFQVATARVYKNLNLRLTKCEKKIKNFCFEVPAFNARRHLCNDLETVTIADHPEIKEIKKTLLELGAEGALMSGSGPSVFGLFADRRRMRRACETLKKASSWRLYAAELLV